VVAYASWRSRNLTLSILLKQRQGNLVVCIIGSPSSENPRGPQKFVVQFSKWLSHRSIKGVVICGSLRKLATSINVNNISTTLFENEESALIKHLPSLVFSLSFSFLSFLKIIHLNKKHRLSMIHAQDANYSAMAAIVAARIIRVPVVLHIHGINMNVIRLLLKPKWLEKSVIARLYRAYYLFLQKELIKRSDCVICVSEGDTKILPIGEKILIPMGVDTASFQLTQNSAAIREEFRVPKHAFTLGYVGALSAGKGLHLLLKLFHCVLQEMPQEASKCLLIVGDGPQKRGLEELAIELGISQYLRFTGFRTDVVRLLSIMDIFVFLSESEGSPTAILEAMASGKAIIASDISSIREIVRNGEEAILVDPRSMPDLKRAVMLLYNDPDLRAELGRKARTRAELYDIDRVYGQILKLYEKLVATKRNLNCLRS